MKHTLKIRIRRAEGALLRALGTAERRGFCLESVRLHRDVGPCQLLQMVVSSPTRSVTTLGRQLERLIDVTDVTVVASDLRRTASAGA